MEYESLGHMARAPLAYSLAMIEYANVPSIAEHAGSIMEQLRDDYPDINEFNITSLKVDIDSVTGASTAQQQVIKQWKMNNPESDFGLVFGAERVVIHTTAYQHFDGFAQKVRKIVDVIHKTARINYSKNIGIRHIDNIAPIDSLNLADLVKPGYLCPKQSDNLAPLQSRVEFVYTSEIGRLFVRAYQLANHPRVPQDLFQLAGELASQSDLMTPVATEFILADTDHIYTPNKFEQFDIDKIIDTLNLLHQQCSLGFREMVTSEAIDAWRKEES